MQEEYVGFGSLVRIKEVLGKEKPSSIYLVTGKNSYPQSGAQHLESLLSSYKITSFSDFSVNPQLEEVRKGIALFKQSDCDLVIAVGGGSVIDMAKSINFLTAQSGEPERYIKKEINAINKPKPLVAVPTTAGTGSEATNFAVVYIGKIKYSLGHKEWMLPKYVFLDYSLTLGLPKYLTASTGMDALCQAVESYWSIQSTEESKDYARRAISLVLDNLAAAVNVPSSTNREAMLLAANLAGKAINISKTTACHSVSYPMTSYFGISHGHACALTLGEMCVYNSMATGDDCLDNRGENYVRETISEICLLFQVQTPEQLQHKVKLLLDQIGLVRKLADLNITTPEHHDIIVANGFSPERVKNNPRLLTENALRNILQRIS